MANLVQRGAVVRQAADQQQTNYKTAESLVAARNIDVGSLISAAGAGAGHFSNQRFRDTDWQWK